MTETQWMPVREAMQRSTASQARQRRTTPRRADVRVDGSRRGDGPARGACADGSRHLPGEDLGGETRLSNSEGVTTG